MLLIAIVLGVAFAWLIETGGDWFFGWLGSDTRREQWRIYRDRASYMLVLVLFIIAVGVLAFGIYGRYTGELRWRSVRMLYFVTLPDSLGAIVGFSAGAVIFWMRANIKKLFSVVVRPRPQISASPGRHTPPRASGGQDDGAKETYPWLTGIVGIAAVTLVAIVTLIIFFPEILTRVESINVAGVEARFAASASNTVRVTAQSEKAQFTTNYILDKWRAVKNTFESLVEPVRLKFIENAKATPEEIKESEIRKKWALNFLEAFAIPLSDVMYCYSKDFVARDTIVQSKAAPLANDWARFAIRVLRETKEQSNDPQLIARREQERRLKFDRLRMDLYDFVDFVDSDLFERETPCGLSSAESPYGRDKGDPQKTDDSARRNKAYFMRPDHVSLITDMDKNLPSLDFHGEEFG